MLFKAIAGAVVLPLLSTVAFETVKLTAHFRFKAPTASDTSTMRAVVYSTHGSARDVLSVSAAVPAPSRPAAPGTIVVRVAAAALNPVDFKMRRNAQPDAFIPKPKIPGCDVSGTVVDAGTGTPFAVGDKVFGMLPIVGQTWGGLGEYVAADARVFAHAPKTVPLVEAAALPLVGLTVLQVLDAAVGAHPPPAAAKQTRMLVHAAAGGVGSFAVQYARHVLRFEEVVGTASAANADYIKSLGATKAVDYAAKARGGRPVATGVDVVLDPVAWRYMQETLSDDSEVLRPGGEYAYIMSTDWQPNAAESSPLLPFVGAFNRMSTAVRRLVHADVKRVHASAVVPDAAGLARIAGYVDQGLVKPVVGKVFEGLEAAVAAFELLETGHAKGKVLVRLAPVGGEWWVDGPK